MARARWNLCHGWMLQTHGELWTYRTACDWNGGAEKRIQASREPHSLGQKVGWSGIDLLRSRWHRHTKDVVAACSDVRPQAKDVVGRADTSEGGMYRSKTGGYRTRMWMSAKRDRLDDGQRGDAGADGAAAAGRATREYREQQLPRHSLHSGRVEKWTDSLDR